MLWLLQFNLLLVAGVQIVEHLYDVTNETGVFLNVPITELHEGLLKPIVRFCENPIDWLVVLTITRVCSVDMNGASTLSFAL